MGPGGPLEATFPLAGPIRAGAWHLVGDGIILSPVDLRFDVLWRAPSGDAPLATFAHHFDPPIGAAQFDAVSFEATVSGVAAAAHEGDLLVIRFTAAGAMAGTAYIPNGDGTKTHGRIPSLTLPP